MAEHARQEEAKFRAAIHGFFWLLALPALVQGVSRFASELAFDPLLEALLVGLTWATGYYLALHGGRWCWVFAGIGGVSVAAGMVMHPLVGAGLLVLGCLAIAAVELRGRAPGDRREALLRGKTWAERRAGLSLAIPIVLFFLFVLNVFTLPVPREEKPLPMKILVEREPPEPEPPRMFEPEPEPETEEEPVIPEFEVAATRVDSTEEGEEIVDPEEGEPEPTQQEELVIEDPVTQPPMATLRSWVPTTDESAELQQLEEVAEQQQEKLDTKTNELREYIVRREVQSAAKDFELNSDGGLHGAIRTLDVEGFPPETVTKVLDRYGIAYERRFTKPAGGRNYLNAAVTEKGTFRNVNKPGFYDVLVLSNKAVHMMTTKEIDALNERGYDPRTARVRKIVFGIVINNTGEYVLGVTDLEVEQIR